MFCSKCGKPVNDGSLFCTFCGNSVTESAPQSVPIQSTPAAPAETETPAAAVATAVQDVEFTPVSEQQGSPVPEILEQLMHPAPEANSALPPEKYYTFGHLALCLAAVAVMAIVAGVFAGLYFSVR